MIRAKKHEDEVREEEGAVLSVGLYFEERKASPLSRKRKKGMGVKLKDRFLLLVTRAPFFFFSPWCVSGPLLKGGGS